MTRELVPFGWAAFLHARLDSIAPAAPSDWLRRSGYRLVFTDTPTAAFASHEKRTNRVDLSTSLGLVFRGGASGEVSDVVWNGPAFDAGIVAGTTIVAVGDAGYEPETLIAAIRRNRDGGRPIRLVLNTRGRERTVTIDYRRGLRFPRLERVDTIPDRLGALLRSRAAAPSRSSFDPRGADRRYAWYVLLLRGEARLELHPRRLRLRPGRP